MAKACRPFNNPLDKPKFNLCITAASAMLMSLDTANILAGDRYFGENGPYRPTPAASTALFQSLLASLAPDVSFVQVQALPEWSGQLFLASLLSPALIFLAAEAPVLLGPLSGAGMVGSSGAAPAAVGGAAGVLLWAAGEDSSDVDVEGQKVSTGRMRQICTAAASQAVTNTSYLGERIVPQPFGPEATAFYGALCLLANGNLNKLQDFLEAQLSVCHARSYTSPVNGGGFGGGGLTDPGTGGQGGGQGGQTAEDYAPWLESYAHGLEQCLHDEARAAAAQSPWLTAADGNSLANGWSSLFAACGADLPGWAQGGGQLSWIAGPILHPDEAGAKALELKACAQGRLTRNR